MPATVTRFRFIWFPRRVRLSHASAGEIARGSACTTAFGFSGETTTTARARAAPYIESVACVIYPMKPSCAWAACGPRRGPRQSAAQTSGKRGCRLTFSTGQIPLVGFQSGPCRHNGCQWSSWDSVNYLNTVPRYIVSCYCQLLEHVYLFRQIRLVVKPFAC